MAPSNATVGSNLPVYVYFQGGAFNANTRPDFNGSGLIAAADYDMVLVNFNYRVGLFGFLTSKDEIPGNLGLRDQRKVLEWVQDHIAKFGGNPDHVVVGGGSAGAASITMHMMADGGKDRTLFHAATINSASFSTLLTIEESQYQYNNFATRLGCVEVDSLACLRNKTTKEIQEVNTFNLPLPGGARPPLYQWQPVIDGEYIPDYTYRPWDEGKIIKIPTIIGDDTNGGTDFAPSDLSSSIESNLWVADQYPTITPHMFGEINALYPNGNHTCPNEGCYWRQAADVFGDIRFMCPSVFMARKLAQLGSSSSYAYRWNVEDPGLMEAGLGVPHTVETDALLGPEFGKDDVPQSYLPGGINEQASPIIQAYYTSFIRSFDPNKYRHPGSAKWRPWGEGKDSRLVFQTAGVTEMENIGEDLEQKCEYWVKHGVEMLL